jgi:hypothetical protein
VRLFWPIDDNPVRLNAVIRSGGLLLDAALDGDTPLQVEDSVAVVIRNNFSNVVEERPIEWLYPSSALYPSSDLYPGLDL